MTTNIVTPAHERLLAAESAAWDAYEAALAVAQEAQDALVNAGSSVLKAYRTVQWRRDDACNALEAALKAAALDARVVTGDDGLDHYL